MMTPATPYLEVNEILDLLLSKVRPILDNQLVGMYLYGSLASGDFDPKSSDIDFVVVTNEILADETISRLEAMHEQIWASGLKWAHKLEGSYVPKDLIRRHDLSGPPCPTVNEGKFFVDRRGSDWIIQRHIIREYGVVLEGPDPKTLIDPVTPHEIREAVIGVSDEWWFPMLDDSEWLSQRGAEYHAYAVLSMCRALHALEHGTVVSKRAAAYWAQNEFGSRWAGLIERALISQQGVHEGFSDEALDFIRLTRGEIQNRRNRMINYRAYEDRDWIAICQVHDRARPDELIGSCDPRAFVPIEQDKEVEDLKRSSKFVATEGKKVVGFVGVEGDYLAWLYIDPDYYGKGIGRELLRIAVQEIGEGAWTIVLDGNKRAIALYESEGFQEVSRFEGKNAGYPCTCLKMKRQGSESL